MATEDSTPTSPDEIARDGESAPLLAELHAPNDAALWAETLVVLMVAVLPDMFRSTAAVVWPQFSQGLPFAYLAAHWFFRSVQVCAVVAYLIGRSGERWSHFGFTRLRWFDPVIGLALFGLTYALYYCIWYALYFGAPAIYANLAGAARPLGFTAPRASGGIAFLVIASCANGFAEEFVMRGYLIPRFERLLHSTWASLFLTTVLFAAYHTYQGAPGVINVVIVGLIYGAAFCLLRRLWPVAVAHAIADIIGWMEYAT